MKTLNFEGNNYYYVDAEWDQIAKIEHMTRAEQIAADAEEEEEYDDDDDDDDNN